MNQKLVLAAAPLMSLTGVSIVRAQSNHGSNATVEAFGGSRNGGGCRFPAGATRRRLSAAYRRV